MRYRKHAATALFVIAAGAFWYDFRGRSGLQFFPTLLGMNLLVVAARLLQLNGAYAHAERERQRRLGAYEGGAGDPILAIPNLEPQRAGAVCLIRAAGPLRDDALEVFVASEGAFENLHSRAERVCSRA